MRPDVDVAQQRKLMVVDSLRPNEDQSLSLQFNLILSDDDMPSVVDLPLPPARFFSSSTAAAVSPVPLNDR